MYIRPVSIFPNLRWKSSRIECQKYRPVPGAITRKLAPIPPSWAWEMDSNRFLLTREVEWRYSAKIVQYKMVHMIAEVHDKHRWEAQVFSRRNIQPLLEFYIVLIKTNVSINVLSWTLNFTLLKGRYPRIFTGIMKSKTMPHARTQFQFFFHNENRSNKQV